MNLLFVCTGNTCRSPMAKGLAEYLAKENGLNLSLDSSGFLACAGMPASDQARQVMREHYGLDLSNHRAKELTQALVTWADAVVCMTAAHEAKVKTRFPNAKAITLGAWAGQEQDVADPFGGTLSDYLSCAQQMEALLRAGIQKSL